MPAAGVPKAGRDDLLPFEKVVRVVGWLVREIGIERVRLTGGEPLARRGLETLIAALAQLPGVREISLTTNGTLLADRAAALRQAGLSRVNVSLDSLDPARFRELTRGGRLEETLAGIDAAIAARLTPLKLNAVLHRSTWRSDVPRLMAFAADLGVEVRFIELMRTGTEQAWSASEYVSADEVVTWLREIGEVEPLSAPVSEPARRTRVRWRGHEANIGWITPQSHSFCHACERLRLDARGQLRRCLMDPAVFPLAALLREAEHGVMPGDGSAERVTAGERVAHYLSGKRSPATMDSADAMSTIGG
jgi:cyclic pyranopterin phosphate synthase